MPCRLVGRTVANSSHSHAVCTDATVTYFRCCARRTLFCWVFMCIRVSTRSQRSAFLLLPCPCSLLAHSLPPLTPGLHPPPQTPLPAVGVYWFWVDRLAGAETLASESAAPRMLHLTHAESQATWHVPLLRTDGERSPAQTFGMAGGRQAGGQAGKQAASPKSSRARRQDELRVCCHQAGMGPLMLAFPRSTPLLLRTPPLAGLHGCALPVSHMHSCPQPATRPGPSFPFLGRRHAAAASCAAAHV